MCTLIYFFYENNHLMNACENILIIVSLGFFFFFFFCRMSFTMPTMIRISLSSKNTIQPLVRIHSYDNTEVYTDSSTFFMNRIFIITKYIFEHTHIHIYYLKNNIARLKDAV